MTDAVEGAKLRKLLAAEYGEDDDRIDRDVAVLATLTPFTNRLIVTRPEVSAYHGGRTSPGGIHIPQNIRSPREFGMSATVLKIGPEVDCVSPGDIVVVPEYAGKPIHLDRDLPFWIIGIGDVMVKIVEDDVKRTPKRKRRRK